MENFKVTLLRYPSTEDWARCKALAMNTVLGKNAEDYLDSEIPFEWKRKIIKARHSPIRTLMYTIKLENIPSWVATHYVRHKHAEPYCASQRNDRQANYDRNAARQDAPVNLILDMNVEEFVTVMQKRLCTKASPETREVAVAMLAEVIRVTPEVSSMCRPPCELYGKCFEMKPCENVKKANRIACSGFFTDQKVEEAIAEIRFEYPTIEKMKEILIKYSAQAREVL